MAARAPAGDNWLVAAAIGAGVWLLWAIWRDMEASEAATYDANPQSPNAAPTPPKTPGAGVALPFSPGAPDTGIGGALLNAVIPQTLSPAGEAFLKRQEGWTAIARPDAGGQEIGWGHKIRPGENFAGGITPAQGQALFVGDVAHVIQLIDANVHVPVNQNQFDALVSLGYNVEAALAPGSSIIKALNVENYPAAAKAFSLYVKSQGRVSSALQRRRKAEQGLFSS
jgi:lysozyme